MMFEQVRGIPLSNPNVWRTVIMLVMSSVLLAGPVQGRTWHPDASDNMRWLAEVDGAGAARIVESRTGGKVLGVYRQEHKGRTVYRVKVLLPEGRVRMVTVDAATGQMEG